jgi:hypothetical protein
MPFPRDHWRAAPVIVIWDDHLGLDAKLEEVKCLKKLLYDHVIFCCTNPMGQRGIPRQERVIEMSHAHSEASSSTRRSR